MGRRIDYLDDPNAPEANSLVPSANVAVFDDQGRLLLIRRSDNGNWAMPGGAMDPGERMTECAVRETLEETGVHCEVTGFVGMYTDPGHVIHYTNDGECRQECSFVFRARATGGEPTPSSESTQVVWVTPNEVGEYGMHPSMALRVRHAVEKRTEPYLG